MDIEELFPDDPVEPTVKYAGANRTVFAVPWAEGRIQLGAGFNTQRAQHDALFLKRSAFRDTHSSQLQYRECQSTSIKDESGTNIANSSQNASFAISASIGGSFLGASGRASYEKSVRDNKNTSSISVCAEHTCGQIDSTHLPQLEINAARLLRTALDPINEFRLAYGDFYVAGYRVGALNNTTISGELANKTFFEAKRAELDVKALFIKVHKSINEVNQAGSDDGGLNVSAFDSLTAFYSNFTAHTFEESLRAGNVAAENKQRAMTVANRAAEILDKEFSLGHEGTLSQDAVDRLCDKGLVTELLLSPFASLREYQSLLALRFNRH